MWIVVTYKKNELNILLKSLKDKFNNNINFYHPKVKISSFKNNKLVNKSKPLLNDYLFCFSNNFTSPQDLSSIMNTRGLKSVVGECFGSQNEINDFIKLCKSIEDKDGLVIQNKIFDLVQNQYYRFTSGPFANLIFKLLEKNKKDFKVLIGKVTTKISTKNNYNFQLV